MTSKEALERVLQIKRYNRSRIPACSTIRIFSDEKEAEETLENAINRLEELEKVLKIIKEKQVMLPIFMTICALYGNEALKAYNSMVGKGRKLTQTEFNLLKEYLK